MSQKVFADICIIDGWWNFFQEFLCQDIRMQCVCVVCITLLAFAMLFIYEYTILLGCVSVKLTKNTYSFAIWFDESLSLHRAPILWLSTEWFKSFLRIRKMCVWTFCVFVLCVLTFRITNLPFGQFIFLVSTNGYHVALYEKIPKHLEMKTTCSTNFT